MRADTPTSLPFDSKRRIPSVPLSPAVPLKRARKEVLEKTEVTEEVKEIVEKQETLPEKEKIMSSDDGEYFDYEDEGFEDPLDGKSQHPFVCRIHLACTMP